MSQDKKERILPRGDAKTIVDTLFNGGVLHPELTRDDMNALEELIDYMMESRMDGYVQAYKLFESINKSNKQKL